jgi:hypothetical protein
MIDGPAFFDSVPLHHHNIVQKSSRVDLLMWGLNAKPYHEQFQAKISIMDCTMPDGTRIL